MTPLVRLRFQRKQKLLAKVFAILKSQRKLQYVYNHNQSQGCVTAIFSKEKWSRVWTVLELGGVGAATEKVPSASLLNSDPEISKRNWFVDLSTLAEAQPWLSTGYVTWLLQIYCIRHQFSVCRLRVCVTIFFFFLNQHNKWVDAAGCGFCPCLPG